MWMSKSQSAMEYLMTYGWAILIIAIVLGAIYSLGLFNGATLAPRSQPGSCQVLRPNGALTTQYVSLAGSCTNELPQYVAKFNGQNSHIATTASGFPLGSSTVSEFVWIYPQGIPGTYGDVFTYGAFTSFSAAFLRIKQGIGTMQLCFNVGSSTVCSASAPVLNNTWNFVGFVYSGGTSMTLYSNANPAPISYGMGTVLPPVDPAEIGTSSNSLGGNWYSGMISNLQLYNTSLDPNSVKALYQEGIGGAPINLQNLVGWWPLNGNANDYSGDVNNGQPTNIVYTNQWLSGYTVP